ncbi:MAG: hypothetical protein MZV63_29670 [Marinilabiliales bacterium]|nr:hypothetical protein [Marinilabiliales bacterium]
MLAIKIGEVITLQLDIHPYLQPAVRKAEAASLMFPIMLVIVIWAFGYILYRKKIIIRL